MAISSVPPRVPDGRAARYAGQRERRRAEFVEAARRAIAEHGPEVSVEQIAAEAGVARTRIYRHFDDIADLQREITTRAAELLLAKLAPAWNPSGSARELISAVIRGYVSFVADNANLYRYTLAHLRHSGAADEESYSALRGAISGQIARLFSGYARALQAADDTAEPLAFGIVGLVESATDRWLDQPAGLDREQLAVLLSDWAWALISHALLGDGRALDPDEPLPAFLY